MGAGPSSSRIRDALLLVRPISSAPRPDRQPVGCCTNLLDQLRKQATTLYRVEVSYDHQCFGCGANNPEGLQMRFVPVAGESVCEYVVPRRYQSWEGMIHGGVIALMLDEAVGWAAWHADRPGVTGKLEVRYRLPLKVGERIRVVGRIDRTRRNLSYAVSHIERLADGARIAEAGAVLMTKEVGVR